MYTLGVRRSFIARHYLIGGDWGPENEPNSHHYLLEIQLSSEDLDKHGYLVDITDVERVLGAFVERYADKMLNDLPEFADMNPSLENFARIAADYIGRGLSAGAAANLTIKLWENETAWAAYAPPSAKVGSRQA
jgi:6-pyruvoyltetrahydropterin/6-carboxytetrahydropterin synthase